MLAGVLCLVLAPPKGTAGTLPLVLDAGGPPAEAIAGRVVSDPSEPGLLQLALSFPMTDVAGGRAVTEVGLTPFTVIHYERASLPRGGAIECERPIAVDRSILTPDRPVWVEATHTREYGWIARAICIRPDARDDALAGRMGCAPGVRPS